MQVRQFLLHRSCTIEYDIDDASGFDVDDASGTMSQQQILCQHHNVSASALFWVSFFWGILPGDPLNERALTPDEGTTGH